MPPHKTKLGPLRVQLMSYDKIFFTAFISILVGFITAMASIVRLVNDKENKTTDYRQAWNDSLRRSLSDLISNINLLATALIDHLDLSDGMRDLTLYSFRHESENQEEKIPESIINIRDELQKRQSSEKDHIYELRKNMHQSYALSTLHFKPNDISFSRVEQKFSLIVEMLDRLSGMKNEQEKNDRILLSEKIKRSAHELEDYSRDILKTEWETVKKGETAYQKTKKWSINGGWFAFFLLFIFGVLSAIHIAYGSNENADNKNIIENSYFNIKCQTDNIAKENPQPLSTSTQTINLYSDSAPHSSIKKLNNGVKIAKNNSCSK